MSDTSEDYSSESSWTPYAERAEWSDVQPLEQDDGPVPVVRIAYSSKCKTRKYEKVEKFKDFSLQSKMSMVTLEQYSPLKKSPKEPWT